jgi:calcineurin-like phosphoesterase family protein
MTIWITSDTHFFHTKIVEYCPTTRPFENSDVMSEALLDYWTATVKPTDEIYVLGDLAMGRKERLYDLLPKLTGQIKLVLGNHDYRIRKEVELHRYFAKVDKLKEVTINKQKIVMCHYPMARWDGMGHGAIHFHGHCHGSPTGLKGRIKDVGLDTNGFKFYNMEDLIVEMQKIPVTFDHHGDL